MTFVVGSHNEQLKIAHWRKGDNFWERVEKFKVSPKICLGFGWNLKERKKMKSYSFLIQDTEKQKTAGWQCGWRVMFFSRKENHIISLRGYIFLHTPRGSAFLRDGFLIDRPSWINSKKGDDGVQSLHESECHVSTRTT